MTRPPRIIRTVPALRHAVSRLHGDKIALVPTMGALHDGHLALVRLAKRRARRVIVSVFVNPAQFAPNEDFASYPRNLESDVAMLAGVDLIWAPTVELMYPPYFATRIVPEGPAKAGLEDAFRPHFFGGVATVVTKLLIQCTPDIAIFGEKDYQQLKVITRLTGDLDIPVEIFAAPMVRELTGSRCRRAMRISLPMSDAAAPTLYRVLKSCAAAIARGEPIARVLDDGGTEIEGAGFRLDYLELRNAETLDKVKSLDQGPLRLLVAARIGKARLIDNIAVEALRNLSGVMPKRGAAVTRKGRQSN